jgi:hypothetical protein
MTDINPVCKFALIIGINYVGTGYDLHGCLNDADNMIAFLVSKRGYLRKNITVLTDKTPVKPTSFNIQNAISDLIGRSLTKGAKELWLHYSGHGTYIKDLNRDEKDGRDECIVPLDFTKTGFIVDDKLNDLIRKLPAVCRMICMFDSCYSGTVLDLKYVADVNNSLSVDNSKSNILGRIVMISGCTDTQTSADAWINGKWAGAMTTSFLACYSNKISYFDLATKMRTYLKARGFTQSPRVDSSYILTGKDIL